MLRLLLCAVALLGGVVACGTPARAEPRLALVVGVADYVEPYRLANPVNDAKLIAGALTKARFETTVLKDPTKGRLKDAVDALRTEAAKRGPTTTVAFYFAGHGAKIEDLNYLIPAGTQLLPNGASRGQYSDQAVTAQEVINDLGASGAARLLVIIDACRTPAAVRAAPDLSFAGARSIADGPQVAILYATQSGAYARDNRGKPNSDFTRILSSYITLGLNLREIVSMVIEDTSKADPQNPRPDFQGNPFSLAFSERATGASKDVVKVDNASSAVGVSEISRAKAELESVASNEELLRAALAMRPLPAWRADAEGGDGFAGYLVGLASLLGQGGVPRDVAESQLWMKRATLKGVVRAAKTLGDIACCLAEPQRRDQSAALEWFTVASEGGSAPASLLLGFHYRDSEGPQRRIATSTDYFVRAAKQGEVVGWSAAAGNHFFEKFGALDRALAYRYYLAALDAGDGDAALNASYLDWEGGEVSRAVDLLIRGSALGCEATCDLNLASYYGNSKYRVFDPAKAHAALERAAGAGSLAAMSRLAAPLTDPAAGDDERRAAYQWARKAEAAGDVEQSGPLATALLEGRVVDRDPAAAARYLKTMLALEDKAPAGVSVWPVRFWRHGRTLAELNDTGAFAGASKAEAARLYMRYGAKEAPIVGISVRGACFDGRKSAGFYVTDWGRDESPIKGQLAWYAGPSGHCEFSAADIKHLDDLFMESKRRKVSFVGLVQANPPPSEP